MVFGVVAVKCAVPVDDQSSICRRLPPHPRPRCQAKVFTRDSFNAPAIQRKTRKLNFALELQTRRLPQVVAVDEGSKSIYTKDRKIRDVEGTSLSLILRVPKILSPKLRSCADVPLPCHRWIIGGHHERKDERLAVAGS